MQIGYIPAVACCDQHSMRGSPTYAGKKRRFSYTKPHPDERCHQSKLVPRRDTPPITVHGNAGPHTCCSSSRISVLPIGGSRRGPRTNDGQRFPRQHHFLGQFFPFSLVRAALHADLLHRRAAQSIHAYFSTCVCELLILRDRGDLPYPSLGSIGPNALAPGAA